MAVTEILENTDIDLTVLINWEDEAICEIPDCDQPAYYIASFNPCACEHLNICKEIHLDFVEKWNEAWRMGLLIKRCAICKIKITHIEIRPI